MAESKEKSTSENFEAELDKIQKQTELDLEKANTRDQKISVYEETIRKYEELLTQKSLDEKQKESLNTTIQYLQKRIEIFRKSIRERREESPLNPENNHEITWANDKRDVYLSNFLTRHPGLAAEFSDEIEKITQIENNNKESLDQKIGIYRKLLTRVEEAIKKHEELTAKIRKYQNRKNKPDDFEEWVKERKELGNYKSLRKFRAKFSTMIIGLKDAHTAFERFYEENERIKKGLLEKIKTGEIKVSPDAPYVIYVNKAIHEQYGVIYSYDEKTQKLTLKSYNLVSTGAAEKFAKDHTTISGVYYIAQVYNPKVITYIPEDYGTHLVDRDKYPYKNFEFFKEEKDPKTGETKLVKADYRLHLTKEEGKIGTAQSHGCIRVHRIFNRSLVEIYLHQFERDRIDKGIIEEYEDIENRDIHRPYFQIPVAVQDYIGDQFSEARNYYNAQVERYNKSMSTEEKIAFIKDMISRYEQIAKNAEDELGKTSEKDLLAKRYYREKIQKAKEQIKEYQTKYLAKLEKNIEIQKTQEELREFRKSVEELSDSKVKDMLLKNIDKYLNNNYANMDYKIKWNKKLTELALEAMKLEKGITAIVDGRLRNNLKNRLEEFILKDIETTPLSNEKQMESYYVKLEAKLPKIRTLILLYFAFTMKAESQKDNPEYQTHSQNLFDNIEFYNPDFWIDYLNKRLKEL